MLQIGTGLGPTHEFYALASDAFRLAKLNLWRTIARKGKRDTLVYKILRFVFRSVADLML